MNIDTDGLKSFIGALVLDLFAARGESEMLKERLASIVADRAREKLSPSAVSNTEGEAGG